MFHKFLGSQGLGYEWYRLYMIAPVILMSEKLRRVDIAYDMVHIVVINQYLGVTGLDEHLPQGIPRYALLHCTHLIARNHAVTGLDIREIKNVLEYPDLLVRLTALLISRQGRLDKVIQIHLRESLGGVLLVYAHAQYPEQHT